MKHKFNTTLMGRRISYTGINQYLGVSELLDVDHVSKSVEIQWEACPNTSQRGIDNYDIIVSNVRLNIKFKVTKDFLEPRDIDTLLCADFEEKEYEYFNEVSVFTENSNWTIINDLENPMVSNVSIDFEEGVITIS